MPNWVDNYITISGETEAVNAFMTKASEPYKTYGKGGQVELEDGTVKYDPELQREGLEDSPLMFWNFIKPTEEEQVAYWNESGWYDWNIQHWGVKWDTNDCHKEEHSISEDGKTASVSYQFNTAWGYPEEVFNAMVEQHPELRFEFESEEEQGWGAKFEGVEGSLMKTDDWDIPESHADFDKRGTDCVCTWRDEPDDWYADCPEKKNALDKANGIVEEPNVVY